MQTIYECWCGCGTRILKNQKGDLIFKRPDEEDEVITHVSRLGFINGKYTLFPNGYKIVMDELKKKNIEKLPEKGNPMSEEPRKTADQKIGVAVGILLSIFGVVSVSVSKKLICGDNCYELVVFCLVPNKHGEISDIRIVLSQMEVELAQYDISEMIVSSAKNSMMIINQKKEN